MKRRDFVKAGMCLGGAGILASLIPVMKKENITTLSDIELFLKERKFLYKSVDELPRRVRLDVCNLCQLNCPACYVRVHSDEMIEKNGGFGYVSFETFKKFVDENPFIREIGVSNNGEIFLNPELEKIIEYAYKKNIILDAYTGVNLNYLPESVAECLVKYKFNGMNVAIDGATPEVYKIYRRGGDFNTVINNVKMINKYKKKYNSEYPRLIYQFIVFGHNEHEIEQAKILAKKLDMDIKFVLNFVQGYSPFKNPKRIFELTGLEDQSVDKRIMDYKNKNTGWMFCSDLWHSPQINYNGDLFGCCIPDVVNFKANVFEQGLLNALNSRNILYAKLILSDMDERKNERQECRCSNCFVYESLKRNNCVLDSI